MSSQSIQLYVTKSHDCGYMDDKQATNLVPDPNMPMTMAIYSQLIQLGYRRSGDHTYRPHCENCSECVPCRVPVNRFIARKTQQRCLKRNQDLSISIVPAHYSDEHFALYSKYLFARHPDGGMANPEPDDFKNFLYCDWSDTQFIEIRHNQQLKAVAVTDKVNNGLSAVYSYFDPSEKQRGLGSFCVLQQIQLVASLGLDYLYLGYWINQNKKMHYKANFKPLETFTNNFWTLL